MNNPNVLICSHDNLRERKFKQKRDFLHLTDAGTSRLANNLKYKIAESLNIEVVRKRNNEHGGRNDRYNYGRLDTNRLYRNNDRTNNNGENTNDEIYQSFYLHGQY